MTEHHATVCIATSLDSNTLPRRYKTQSEDISHIVCDRLSIDEVRKLRQDAQQMPVSDTHRVFVILTKKLPPETQNALLKLFEEPPEYARFYLLIPQEGLLLPTLASRVQIVHCVTEDNTYTSTDVFNLFLGSPYKERMETIADITKKKDVDTIASILEGAEVFVAQNPVTYAQVLDSIVFIRRYISTQGASAKMLLEELALSLPMVK